MTLNHPKYSKKPTFKKTGLEQPITKIASPLLTNQNDIWNIDGTCVMIAPGLAITAKHVITDAVKKYDKIDLDIPSKEDIELQVTHNSYVFQIIDGKIGYRWSVKQYFPCPISDICYLTLRPMFDFKKLPVPQNLSITLIPPTVGERIQAFGYPRSGVKIDGKKIELDVNPMTTVGEVITVYDQRRDTKLISFPAFQTNARFDPGMSGGPVFNDSGKLCGLICSGMFLDNSESDHISFASLLWPSMGTKVWLKLEYHDLKENFPVLFLAEHEYIQAEGWERVSLNSPNLVTWNASADE